jgi:uncharacterized protein YjlB
MPLLEQFRKGIERVTGMGRPDPSAVATRSRKANAHCFRDDGKTPNNPRLPLIHYRGAVVLEPRFDPAAIFEVLFESNGWVDQWRDGIYPYLHFHTNTHEVLGIARGSVKVRFGGKKGRALSLKAGDVIVQPAGTGHRRLGGSKDLLVVGAYPKGSGYDEPRPGEVDADRARERIAAVPVPPCDPVYGRGGPMIRLWNSA